jgi:DNA-binding MurR/RpiR family transcriptional regulator
MKMKAEIEIDMYVDLEPEGIRRELYIGEGACEPELESLDTWEEIIERNIEYYIRPIDKTISSYDMEGLEKIVAGMEQAVALFKEKIEEYRE